MCGTGISHDVRVDTGVVVRMDVVPEAGREEEEDVQGTPASCALLGMSEHLWRHRRADLSQPQHVLQESQVVLGHRS